MADDDLPDLVGRLGQLAQSKTFWTGAVYVVLVSWVVTVLAAARVGEPDGTEDSPGCGGMAVRA